MVLPASGAGDPAGGDPAGGDSEAPVSVAMPARTAPTPDKRASVRDLIIISP
jgi:hypothetical protein